MATRLIVLVLVVLLPITTRAADSGGIVNKVVSTTLDLTTHIAKITVAVTLENNGDKAVNHVQYLLDPLLADKLAYIIAESEDKPLVVVDHVTPTGRSEKQIKLLQPLSPSATIKLKILVVYSHAVLPFPRLISQSDKQLVQFTASGVYYLSAYPTVTQTLTAMLPSGGTIESFTRIKPVAADGSQVAYGPYSDVKAFTSGAPRSLVLHYENNSPFLSVTRLDRLIEVSHWGNIAVEEAVQVQHTGAVLKGSFSRYDYQRSPNSGQSSVKSYKSLLPAASTDVYYRDEIGNISTSHMRVDEDTVEVELRPRFPLFGGWQTKYTIGYNVPGYEYLYHSSSHFALKMRVVDHVFDEQVVDHLTLRIILPEGATNIQFKPPYPMDKEEHSLHHTYLDTIGRPVVVITKNNLVEQHIADFELRYDFQLYLLLQEPLLVVTALLVFFFSIIVCVRMDFAIAEDKAELSRQQATVILDNIRTQQDNRMMAVSRCDNIIASYKSSKDQKKFRASGRDLQNRYHDTINTVNNLHKELSSLDPDTAAKVVELQKKAGELWSTLHQLLNLTEQVLTDNIKKESYVEQERKAQEKKQKIIEDIDGIVKGF